MVIDAEPRFAILIHNDDWGGPGALRRLDDLLFQPLINLSIYDFPLLARGPIHWQGYGVSSWYHINFHFPSLSSKPNAPWCFLISSLTLHWISGGASGEISKIVAKSEEGNVSDSGTSAVLGLISSSS